MEWCSTARETDSYSRALLESLLQGTFLAHNNTWTWRQIFPVLECFVFESYLLLYSFDVHLYTLLPLFMDSLTWQYPTEFVDEVKPLTQ